MVFRCCVPNCAKSNRQVKMHRFPNELKLFNEWKRRSGNKSMLNKGIKAVNSGFRICDKHFADEVRIIGRSGSNLKKYCLPTLHLPSYNGNKYELTETEIDLLCMNGGSEIKQEENKFEESSNKDLIEIVDHDDDVEFFEDIKKHFQEITLTEKQTLKKQIYDLMMK